MSVNAVRRQFHCQLAEQDSVPDAGSEVGQLYKGGLPRQNARGLDPVHALLPQLLVTSTRHDLKV